MIRSCALWLLIGVCSFDLFAQGSAGSEGKLEPRYLIDIPTAGMPGKGSFALDIDFYQEGGLLMGITVGILDRFCLGVSYGGSQLLGDESPVMNEAPGVQAKVRLFEESVGVPAIVLGFDSQGKDGYLQDLDRYVIKSPGLYAALSKNYAMLGFFSMHAGVNYSFERSDGDRGVNIFAGVEKTLGPVLSLVAEYNAALNDNGGEATGKGRGYLNVGIRWAVGGGLTLSAYFKDLLKNGGALEVANRTVRIEYAKAF